MACDGSSLAKVHFRDSSSNWDSFSTIYCPVSVVVETSPITPYIGGQCFCISYDVTCNWDASGLFGQQFIGTFTALRIRGAITDIRLKDYGGFNAGVEIDGQEKTATTPCVPTMVHDYRSCFNPRNLRNIVITRVDGLADNCGNPPTTYALKITDTRGLVFSKSFNSQPEYYIQCGDDCPPGFMKCTHPSGIGFCCIDCQGLNNRVANLANRIR